MLARLGAFLADKGDDVVSQVRADKGFMSLNALDKEALAVGKGGGQARIEDVRDRIGGRACRDVGAGQAKPVISERYTG